MPKAVILVSGKHPGQAGGHETYVRAHALAATAAGFEPHIFCADSASSMVAHDFGIVHSIAWPLPVHSAWACVCRPFLASAIETFLRDQSPPHLIHGFGPWSCVSVAVKRRLARRGVAVTVLSSAYATLMYESRAHVERSRIERSLAKWLRYRIQALWIRAIADRMERQGYAGSRLVLVNYDSVRRLLLDAYNLAVEIRRIPYATVLAFRDSLASAVPGACAILDSLAPADAPLVVCVSRHTPRKGIDVLIHALAQLNRAGVGFRACLIGPGTMIEVHRRMTAELGLSGKVAIPGQVENPFEYLRRADIYVLPSLAEASGSLSLLEAMQAGTAIVASACDGIPEDLTAGQDALMFPPGDATALSRALAQLIADGALRERLSERARATYQRRFSAAAFTQAIASTYRDLGFVP